jgi:hypothetical protein
MGVLTMTARKPLARYYVGVRGKRREVFRYAGNPTQRTHGKTYDYVIGPFRTRAGAVVMAKHGGGNPHLQTVADAERRAAKERGKR